MSVIREKIKAKYKKIITINVVVLFALIVAVVFFQNCGQPGRILEKPPLNQSVNICDGVSCTLDPLTTKPAVTTILLALGDEANAQLVIKGASAQFVAETVVRYTSPVLNPKILVVKDRQSTDESANDTAYVVNTLLSRYITTFIDEPVGGLQASDVVGFDVVWFNNPGHPMSSEISGRTLINFSGGVVLQGDDLSQGSNGEVVEALTGLRYIDNGVQVTCDGKDYFHNDNGGEQYRITLSQDKFPDVDTEELKFRYGNDIDLTAISADKLEVLAQAQGGPANCTELRPVIVRYAK